MRLNFTRTILNDSGIFICELVVSSERHVVNGEGGLTLGGQAVIGTPLRHQFMLTLIGESANHCNNTYIVEPVRSPLPWRGSREIWG